MTMRSIIQAIIVSFTLLPAVLLAQSARVGMPAGNGDDPVSCEAAFTYEQNSTDPLIFNFTDHSTGDIINYSWDFGDGSTGAGQVVSHSFPELGQSYTVCLTVSNNDTSNFCSDSVCMTIDLNPLPSYQLGGLLYAGNFPINNPFNTNDYGYAYLYRLQGAVILPVDTVLFDTLGYFYFTDVPAGDYLVKAGMKPYSSHFSAYMPCYYQSKPGWSEADTVHLNADFFMAHIHMKALKQIPSGNHSVGGYVMFDDELAPITRVTDCEVILSDSTGEPVKVAYTDPSGVFRFDLLPPGMYVLKAEFTGLWSDIIQFTLHDSQAAPDSIEIQLHHSPQGIGSHDAPVSFEVNCFPNPASDKVSVDIRVAGNTDMHYELISPMGVPLLRKDLRLSEGTNREQISVSAYPPGIYVLIFSDLNSGGRVPAKIVIR
jgi:PKD repeat protein